jgi:hypothetical protein
MKILYLLHSVLRGTQQWMNLADPFVAVTDQTSSRAAAAGARGLRIAQRTGPVSVGLGVYQLLREHLGRGLFPPS